MTTLANYIEYSTRSPRQSNWAVKRKVIQIRNKKLNVSNVQHQRSMTRYFYRGDPKDSTNNNKKSLLELTATTKKNSLTVQDIKSKCKNQFCFYTLAMNYPKRKLRK